ncbi:hypothetical protein BJF86_14860 [Serinicoccus sp. CNJ-927]|nr:hypothetical protein BJF86_14860 [Serinicoccus sp. CNJ-927]
MTPDRRGAYIVLGGFCVQLLLAAISIVTDGGSRYWAWAVVSLAGALLAGVYLIKIKKTGSERS